MAENPIVSSFQKAYSEQCLNLIKTLCIKNSIHAELINQGLKNTLIDYEVPADKRQWKYYLNISGEYHETDSRMQVTSLDTQETINFTKEELEIHVATYDAYRYGSRQYYSLVNQYPENERLIQGILYPADIDEAIEASDGTILSFDSRYVEPQEMSLIQELEDNIKRHMARWTVPSYATSDNYYHAADWAVMCLNLVPLLFNLRVKRCHTDEAHSFHIRQYLASHFELEEHYDYLSLEQKLYLYRNLMRLSKNFGKNEQFYELVDRILARRYIPLADYSVRHLRSMDSEHRPKVISRKLDVLNPKKSSVVEYVDIDKLYDKEYPLNAWNPMELEDNRDKITLSLMNGPSGVLQTKVLESEMVDYTNASPDRLNEVLLRELIYSVYKNRYLAYCEFRDPKTGMSHTLSTRNALIYMLYIAYKLAKIDVPVVPGAMAYGHLLDPIPTKEELMSVADKGYESRERLAKYLISNMPTHKPIHSLDAFFRRGYAIYEQTVRHWDITSNTEDMYDRAEAQKMCSRMFGYTYVEFFDTPVDMQSWLINTNLPEYDRTDDEASSLIMRIFESVTGLSLNNSRSVPSIQKSLIKLMKKITSYSVQYIANINEDPIHMLRRIAVRTSKPRTTGLGEYKENPLVDVIHLTGIAIDYFDGGNLTGVNLESNQSIKLSPIQIDPIVDTEFLYTSRELIDYTTTANGVNVYKSDNTLHSDADPFIGYDFYKTLTQEQIKSIPNV